MKLVSRFSGFLLLLFFAACQQNDVLSEAGEPRTASVPHQVSVEAALGELSGLLAAIDPPTRGGGRTVAAVGTVTCGSVSGAGTRCAEQPEGNLVHIVQFSEGGYAVLGADDRLPSVIAVVDEGGLTTEAYADMVRNGVPEDENGQPIVYPGIVFGPEVYEQLGYDPADSGQLVLPQFNYEPWTTMKGEALIKTKWGQGAPYNIYTPEIGLMKTPVGCVAVAVAQIMMYMACQYGERYCPPFIAGYEIFWDELIERFERVKKLDMRSIFRDINSVATLMRAVGVAVNMDYRSNGSYAYAIDAVSCLSKYGFEGTSLDWYAYETVRAMLDKKFPVFILAQQSREGKDGHAWVIDAYTFQWRNYQIVDPATKKVLKYGRESRNMVHCNFGWGGANDGYYVDGVFNMLIGPEDTNADDYPSTVIAPSIYDREMQIITFTGYRGFTNNTL